MEFEMGYENKGYENKGYGGEVMAPAAEPLIAELTGIAHRIAKVQEEIRATAASTADRVIGQQPPMAGGMVGVGAAVANGELLTLRNILRDALLGADQALAEVRRFCAL